MRSTAASGSGSENSSTSVGQRRPRGRPFQHALGRRHEGDAALAVLAKQAEIGRGIAEAEHALALASGQRAWMPRLISRRATMPRRCE